MKAPYLTEDRPPELPNGKNPLVERVAYAANRLGLNRAKVNWGYMALIGVLAPTLVTIVFACIAKEWDVVLKVLDIAKQFALPVVTAVVVGNVALKGRVGGRDGG